MEIQYADAFSEMQLVFHWHILFRNGMYNSSTEVQQYKQLKVVEVSKIKILIMQKDPVKVTFSILGCLLLLNSCFVCKNLILY